MSPLESARQLKEEEWAEISAANPPRGRGKDSSQSTEERDLVKLAEDGTASVLVYSNPNERYKKSVQLRTRGGTRIRVIEDPDNPNAIIIGPVV